MLRRALLVAAVVLLGLAGIASAGLVAEPATTTAPVTTTTGPYVVTSGTTVATTTVATTTATPTTQATTTAASPAVAQSSSAATLVISGHGWGHGVGMSQYGADGYARHGWDYRSILAHYYPGTTIAVHAAPRVRVLLADGRARVTLASSSPWKVVDGQGTAVTLPAGPLTLAADLAVAGQTLVSPLTFSPGTSPLELGKAPYRGSFLVVSNGKRLQVVNVLPLESYVLGVVGREMPSSWPAAALEAQAVAARSYALAELENVVTARAFDLYGDTRSQAYGGIAAESPAVTAAVRATARQVVLYAGNVATTYFSSTSGGRTVSAAEAWGKPSPYLQSVPDPYDALSPYHDWGPVLVDAAKAARALKVPGSLVSIDVTPGPSGHVATVHAAGTNGAVDLTGSAVRTALGLRSTWFSVGMLALTPPAAPLAYGASGVLSGVARGVGPVALEASVAGAWQTVSAVTPAADGSFTVPVQATATTTYRLAAGDVRASVVTVPVAPAVSASLAAGAVQGTVRPALAGAAVQLQRQDGAGWTTVASATTDGGGTFAVAAQLAPGSYRVRCAPGHGLSPGVSQPLIQT